MKKALSLAATVALALALAGPAEAAPQVKQMRCVQEHASAVGVIDQCVRVVRLRPSQAVKLVGAINSAEGTGVVDQWYADHVTTLVTARPGGKCRQRSVRHGVVARLDRCKSVAVVRNRGRRAVTISTFVFWPSAVPTP